MKKILGIFYSLYAILLVININAIQLFIGDEQVYAKSTWSILHKFIDNNNHPLLAKTITAGIVLFFHALTGTDLPIFWRLGSIIASLGTLFFFYKIFRFHVNQKLSFLGIVLVATDPLFFVLSRIFNLDSISLFFSVASLYYLLLFTNKHHLKYVWLSAFLMGLSLAAKFNLLFILPALPVIYFMLPFKKIRLLTVTILGYCFAWCGFVIGNGISFIFLWRHNFFTNMNMFFTYIIGILYSNLNMSSKAANTTQISSAWSWFTIPQILTFYRLYYKAQAQVSTVVGFQNPVLFLLTIPAVCIIIYLLIRKKIRKPTSTVIILLYFFGQYLPWLFNIRPTYYYYIFPLIPLIIFLVVRVVGLLPKKTSQNIMVMLAVTSSLFFLAYYPMLIGLNISIRRENISFLYSRYHYPKVNTLFCQFCSPR